MKPLVRLLLMGVVLAFVVGTVVHANDMFDMNAGTASMADGMAPDCNSCDIDNESGTADSACPDVCATPAIAILAAATVVPKRVSQITGFRSPGPIIGRSGPPDPYPPKPVLT